MSTPNRGTALCHLSRNHTAVTPPHPLAFALPTVHSHFVAREDIENESDTDPDTVQVGPDKKKSLTTM
jgi:hypothetical protein